MENSRGSEWRKWDLHMHSLKTHLNNNYSGVNEDALITKLHESEIGVVGLTNYFNFTQEDYELKKKLERHGITVFLNLELRLTYQNKEDQCCDIHIVFNNKLKLKEIDSFLSNLTIKINGHMKKASALSSQDDFINGTVEFEHLIETLNDESLCLKNNYLIGFLSRGHGNGRTSSQYEQLAKECDFLIHSSNSTRNILDDREFWRKQGKALLQSSDAHSLEQIGTKYTWIKADTTFEGLKQIIFEPETRVKIQQLRPDDKNNSQIIDSITLKEDDFWDNTIYLNDNLNVIIGGRSTGKSTLLKSIALKIDPKIDFGEKVDFIKTHLNGVSITWKDNIEEDRYVQFIPQNYMYSMSKNENRKLLNDLIESIIRSMPENHYLEEYVEKNKEIEKYISINKLVLSYLQKDLRSLEEQLHVKGDRKGIEYEIKRLEKQISCFSSFPIEEVESYYCIIKEIEEIKHQICQNNNDIRLLNLVRNILVLNDDINIEMEKLSSKNKKTICNSYKKLQKNMQEQWMKEVEKSIEKMTRQNEVKQQKIDTLTKSDIFLKGENIYGTEKEILGIQTKLKEEMNKLQQIIEIEGKISVCKHKERHLIKDLVRKHSEYKKNADDLSEKLKLYHDDIDISVNTFFRENKFREDYPYYIEFDKELRHFSCYDKKAQGYLKKRLSEVQWDSFISTNWFDYSFELKYQNDNFEQMSPGKKAFVILKLLLEFDKRTCPILIDQPEDSLDNRTIYTELVKYICNKKTMRQIILVTHNSNVVVGADAENVIVANQHGEDSQNKNGIKFQYVNGSLENTKKRDDVERKKNILNSQGIREHICEILEGGDDAFKKREMKYGLK